MGAHCQVTGAKPSFGRNVSHSHRKTNRRWNPNIARKRYLVPSLGRVVTLLSAKGIKTIDKQGIDTVVARLRAQGVRLWMARSTELRPVIKLRSTAGTGTYVTRTGATTPSGWSSARPGRAPPPRREER